MLYGLKTLFGIDRMNALPTLLFSDEALMPLVGFNAQHVRQGVCQRGAAKRQGERTPGPISPETLAHHIVKLSLRDLERLFTGAMRTVAKAGIFAKQVTGMADGTALETTARYRGCGQVTRKVRIEDKQGRAHAIEGTIYGWKVRLLIDAATKIPLAVKVGQIQEHETHWTRALVTQARAHLAGHVRLQQVVFARGLLDGTELWWLDQQGWSFVVPAKTKMAVTADARAQAAAGEAVTVGRRTHTVRHGQGKTARTERLETEVVGITGLTTSAQDGTPEHERHANRRDFQPNPINAVVVRQWHGKDDGPGGNTVLLTTAPVEKPLQVFDDADDRSLIEHGCSKACKQPWDVGHPPQKTARAVQVHVLFTLATAYRWQCEREAVGDEPLGWQRWRRQLLEQTRDQVIVFAHGYDGIFHLAAYSLLLGVKLKDVPPGIGTRQEILAKYELTTRWEIEEEGAAVIRRIFAMALQGMTIYAMAETLSQEGIPTCLGRQGNTGGNRKRLKPNVWAESTVQRILTNTAYIGRAYFQKYRHITKSRRVRRPPEEWIAISVPPIIDEETFDAVQRQLAINRERCKRNRKRDYLLSGFLRCGRCGRRLTGTATRPAPKEARRYHCSSQHNTHDPAARCRGSVKAETIETKVWSAVVRVLENPDIISGEAQRQSAHADEERTRILDELDLIDRALAKLTRKEQRWLDAYLQESIDAGELKRYRAEIDVERKGYQARQAELQRSLDGLGQLERQMETLTGYCIRVRQRLQTFSLSEKRLALEALGVEVTWIPDEPLTIRGTIPLEGGAIETIAAWSDLSSDRNRH